MMAKVPLPPDPLTRHTNGNADVSSCHHAAPVGTRKLDAAKSDFNNFLYWREPIRPLSNLENPCSPASTPTSTDNKEIMLYLKKNSQTVENNKNETKRQEIKKNQALLPTRENKLVNKKQLNDNKETDRIPPKGYKNAKMTPIPSDFDTVPEKAIVQTSPPCEAMQRKSQEENCHYASSSLRNEHGTYPSWMSNRKIQRKKSSKKRMKRI